jgi:hypothetical protein
VFLCNPDFHRCNNALILCFLLLWGSFVL